MRLIITFLFILSISLSFGQEQSHRDTLDVEWDFANRSELIADSEFIIYDFIINNICDIGNSTITIKVFSYQFEDMSKINSLHRIRVIMEYFEKYSISINTNIDYKLIDEDSFYNNYDDLAKDEYVIITW